MNRTILLAALLTILGVAASAYPRIRKETGPDGKSVTFYLEDKDRPGTMTVVMNFTELKNCDLGEGVQRFVVRNSGQRLLTLRPTDSRAGIGYRYSWHPVYGQVDPAVDSTFVYRMPCPTDRPVRVNNTIYALDHYRRSKSIPGRLGYTFYLEKGDTVYAMRRGVVTRVEKSEVPTDERQQYRFTSRSAKITVEHPDGSQAWYINFDPDGMLVREGDQVLPGTPLGMVGTYNGEHYRISVQLFCYRTDPRRAPDAAPTVRHLLPRFATGQGIVTPDGPGIFTAVMTDEMLCRELTKREAKRLRAGKRQ